ncbi:16589_t:CDS:1 [Dentiscutata erythropus]|uniref:Fucosyltransferase n=1 Tax=Dentiscutata erythropus TaxID=1348616 RepID=A0A9N9EBL7_9GLOM|nr:16589_t:CDS:1 [Dentiscutata erythropus]
MNDISSQEIKPETIKLASTPFSSEYLPSSCEHLPSFIKTNTSHREFYITSPKSRELTIFHWFSLTFSNINVSWETISQDLCPYPPELYTFFQRIFEKFARKSVPGLTEWPKGYAPCWLWSKNDEWGTCANGAKYRLTTNYTQWRDVDIIYFDYPFFLKIDEPPYYDMKQMPPHKAGQVWWFRFSDEGLGYYWFVGLGNFLNLFDMTMGSPADFFDIFQPAYGIYKGHIPKFYESHITFNEKKNDVLISWMVGNCDPVNNRSDYAYELMQHITVDSFGYCLHNKELPDQIREKYGIKKNGDTAYYSTNMYDVKIDVLSPYKFHLAFENSNCKGYVTEKVYDSFLGDSIPIYMGAPDIDDYVPPHSIIKVTDFENVEDLVKYIYKVANNQTLYESYFEWKKDKTYENFCKLCRQTEEQTICRFFDRALWV